MNNKKAQMICAIPAALVGGAVMIYCFAANIGGDTPLLYGLGAMIGVFLIMYLTAGRRIQAQEAEKAGSSGSPAAPDKTAASVPAAPASASSSAGDTIALRECLSPEEIRILLADLQTAGDQAPEQKAVLSALAGEISRTGTISNASLPVCVAAVEAGLGVFSAFGLAPAGHTELLIKLKKLGNQ